MTRIVLVADPDRRTINLVSHYLRRDGYGYLFALDGREALSLARRRQPDLIVTELRLPELDGLDVCRLIRSESNVPIIMLSASDTSADKLRCLDLGADDYLTKPFDPEELLARIRAVMRRTNPEPQRRADLRFGELVVSLARHEVLLAGHPVNLTPTEFRLMAALAREPGRAFTRSELLDRAFRTENDGSERNVDVHIMNLRRKIEAEPREPRYIFTVPSVGYRFEGR
jgi:DNA-binding response OmpR family regulator